MRRIIILSISLFVSFVVSGQSSVTDVLAIIEKNNKELSSGAELTTANKLSARVGNSLSNPEVSYSYLFGSAATPGASQELEVMQPFDFPTVYSNRNRISRIKGNIYETDYATLRQDILLEAKLLCVELISLNMQRELIGERRHNAEELARAYEKKSASGDVSAIERSRISLELINVRSEALLNSAAIKSAESRLASLNGGQTIAVSALSFAGIETVGSLAELSDKIVGGDLTLRQSQMNIDLAKQSVALSRSLSLPRLAVGFRRDHAVGESFNGVAFGASIPMFGNRYAVKAAKAQSVYAQGDYHARLQRISGENEALFMEGQEIKSSIDQLEAAMKSNNSAQMLSRALQGGAISVIDYFVELKTLYDTRQILIDLQKRYYDVNSQMLKMDL